MSVVALTALAGCGGKSPARVALTRGIVAEPTTTTTLPPTPPPTDPPPAAQPASSSDDDGGGGGGRVVVNRCASVQMDSGPFVAASAKGSSIAIYDQPGGSVVKTIASPNSFGFPQEFLVKARQGDDWLGVLLPVRPNGAAGWVKTADVNVVQVPYRIQVQLGAHTLTVWKDGGVIMQQPVGLGRSATATPCGEYFLTELLQPTNDGGAYGPFAFGTSAYSDVLTSFAGGNGQIGLHGTNDPGGIGHNVSHGCIRIANSAITELAHELPLGTPLYITP
jgi:lipoprotein-anchoring transpeptidase ErfK/SrfK